MYGKIITHNDFDGVASAAICSYVFKVERVLFCGPFTISRAQITITEKDIVCDLPYPLECGLWFDHHAGNLQELEYRKIDLDSIEGKFDLQPSCARVVYEYLLREKSLPPYFESMVAEADIIDAFNYASIEDWRQETPGKIIDATIKAKVKSSQEKNNYLRYLVLNMRQKPLEEIVALSEIQERYRQYRAEEQEMLKIIEDSSYFLPEDVDQEIIVIDLTRHNRRPHIVKNLAYLLYPNALSVIEIQNLFRRDVKTTDLSFSMSLSLNLDATTSGKDIGEIMRTLNIGDGHQGAAASTVYCSSKNEMIREKEAILKKIYQMWSNQNLVS